MFKIPKLAKGGILTPPTYFISGICENENVKPRVKTIDKYYGIYKRTKKARIKKKAYKKSWLLQLQNKLENITITIGDETKCIEV